MLAHLTRLASPLPGVDAHLAQVAMQAAPNVPVAARHDILAAVEPEAAVIAIRRLTAGATEYHEYGVRNFTNDGSDVYPQTSVPHARFMVASTNAAIAAGKVYEGCPLIRAELVRRTIATLRDGTVITSPWETFVEPAFPGANKEA